MTYTHVRKSKRKKDTRGHVRTVSPGVHEVVGYGLISYDEAGYYFQRTGDEPDPRRFRTWNSCRRVMVWSGVP